jgi:hypothetical protein
MGFSLLLFFKSFAHTNSVAGGGDVRETRGHCGLYFSIPDERVTPSAKCWPGRNSLAAAGYINDYDNQKTWRSANSVGISFVFFFCGNISNLAIFYYFTFIVETERNKIEPKTLLLSPIGRWRQPDVTHTCLALSVCPFCPFLKWVGRAQHTQVIKHFFFPSSSSSSSCFFLGKM